MKKIVLLLIFSFFSIFSMEEPKEPTLADIFNMHENDTSISTNAIKELLMTRSVSKTTNTIITRKISLFLHPDKVQNEHKEIATDFFKLFQDLKYNPDRNDDPKVENQPWLIQVPYEIREIFVHRFFELLERNTTYTHFKTELDIVIKLSYTKSQNGEFILQSYNQNSIDEIISNGLNILLKPQFDELKEILCAKYQNFNQVFDQFILPELKTKYSYLFNLLKEFQTFDRCILPIQNKNKSTYWFEKYNQYKDELQNNSHDNYNFESDPIGQQKVSIAIILDSCNINYQEGLFSDTQNLNLLQKEISSWSNNGDSLNNNGYSTFKKYHENYHKLYSELQKELANHEHNLFNEGNASKDRAFMINDFLTKDIFDFIDKLLINEHSSNFNTETITAACLFCLTNNINLLKILPQKNSLEEKIWKKEIKSFSTFIEHFKDYQKKYPVLNTSDETIDKKIEIVLRFIKLESKDPKNLLFFNTFFTDPFLSTKKIEFLDNYFYFNEPLKCSFSDYVISIKNAAKKYVNDDNSNVFNNNETLCDFVLLENKMFQVIPDESKYLFETFIQDIANDLKKNPESNGTNKIRLLKNLLENYFKPYQLINEAEHIGFIQKKLSFETLKKTIDEIRNHLINANWFQTAANPEIVNIATQWIECSVQASLFNIEPIPFEEIQKNVDSDAKQLTEHLRYFNHYTIFISRYHLIFPNHKILKSFNDWLNATKKQNVNNVDGINGTLLLTDGKNNIISNSLLLPILSLVQTNNPTFEINMHETLSIVDQIENEAKEQLYSSWKFKIHQIAQFAINTGVLKFFCANFGSKLAENFIPYLKQAKKKQHYDEACKYYNVDTIKNPNKKEYIIDQLKTEYNQYSHSDFLNKAIKTATPYLNSSQLKKVLRFF